MMLSIALCRIWIGYIHFIRWVVSFGTSYTQRWLSFLFSFFAFFRRSSCLFARCMFAYCFFSLTQWICTRRIYKSTPSPPPCVATTTTLRRRKKRQISVRYIIKYVTVAALQWYTYIYVYIQMNRTKLARARAFLSLYKKRCWTFYGHYNQTVSQKPHT